MCCIHFFKLNSLKDHEQSSYYVIINEDSNNEKKKHLSLFYSWMPEAQWSKGERKINVLGVSFPWTFAQVYGRVLERWFINNKKTFKESKCLLQAPRIAFFNLWWRGFNKKGDKKNAINTLEARANTTNIWFWTCTSQRLFYVPSSHIFINVVS